MMPQLSARSLERASKVGSAILASPRVAAKAAIKAPRKVGSYVGKSWTEAADFIFEIIDGPDNIQLPSTMEDRDRNQAKINELLQELRREKAEKAEKAKREMEEAAAAASASSSSSSSADSGAGALGGGSSSGGDGDGGSSSGAPAARRPDPRPAETTAPPSERSLFSLIAGWAGQEEGGVAGGSPSGKRPSDGRNSTDEESSPRPRLSA